MMTQMKRVVVMVAVPYNNMLNLLDRYVKSSQGMAEEEKEKEEEGEKEGEEVVVLERTDVMLEGEDGTQLGGLLTTMGGTKKPNAHPICGEMCAK